MLYVSYSALRTAKLKWYKNWAVLKTNQKSEVNVQWKRVIQCLLSVFCLIKSFLICFVCFVFYVLFFVCLLLTRHCLIVFCCIITSRIHYAHIITSINASSHHITSRICAALLHCFCCLSCLSFDVLCAVFACSSVLLSCTCSSVLFLSSLLCMSLHFASCLLC